MLGSMRLKIGNCCGESTSLGAQVCLLKGECLLRRASGDVVFSIGNVIPSRADHVKCLRVPFAPLLRRTQAVGHLLNGRGKCVSRLQVSDIAVDCHPAIQCSRDSTVGATQLVSW